MTVPVVESWVRAERLTWLDGDLLMAVAPITAGVQVWGCGCDDQITTAAKRRTYVRDDLGRFDDVPGGGGVSADKLRLQRWAPVGFTVRSSKKVKNENSDLGIAEVDGPDGPQIRIGAVDPDSGKWDAGFSGEARMAALREQIEQKQDDFDNESDHDQAVALEDEIGELESELETLDQDRTAVLTPAAMADFRRRLGEASTLARSNKAEQDSALRAYEALDKQRADIIAEFSDTELEEEISQAQGHLWARNYRLRLVRGDSKYARYIPEAEADAAEAERDLAPLLVERAELMPPGPRVQLEELERRQGALNADDIDGIITSAEISSADGMRVLAEVWGSDDVDDDWVTTRFYVLAPGESTDDADDQGRDAQFRGLKGLNKLIAGLEPVDGPTVAAVVWGCGCPTTAAKDVIVRDGHSITVNRDGQGQFAEKADADLSKLKVPELRKLATARGLKGLSKATRPQLVEALRASSVDSSVVPVRETPSDAVSPLPRTSGRKQPTPSAAAKATNPNYGSTYNGAVYREQGRAGQPWTPNLGPLPSGAYEENCTNAVNAFEMRMRGFDVTASPLDVLDKYGYAAGRTYEETDQLFADIWRLPDGKPHGRGFDDQKWRSFAEIDTEIRDQWPDGGRGVITVGKHIFNVVKANGKAQYIDAQSEATPSRIVTTLYKKRYRGAKMWSDAVQEGKLIRLDDLVPTGRVLDAVQASGDGV